MSAPAEIIVTGPDGVVARFPVKDRTVIGRHPECEIVLTDPMSSRRHCVIERSPQGLFSTEDNKSANGTILNGEPLKTRMPLKNGDTIQIGSTLIVLRLEVAAARASTRQSGGYEPALSIVRLEDETAANAPSFDFAQKADAQMVSEEEAATSDVVALKRVTERLKLLIDVSQSMGTSLDPQKLLNTCLDKLFEVFPQADRGLIVLYGPDGSLPATLAPEKDQGATLDRRKHAMTRVKLRQAHTAQDNEIKLSKTVLNRIRTQRQSVLVSDASADSGGMSLARFEIKSLMCAPLLIGADDLGFIQLETKSRQSPFNPEDLTVMTAVAGQCAVVIRNSDLALEAAAAAAQKENLSRFLSPNLVDQVLKGVLSVELGGTEKKGTIFFSDIVSFTKLASKMSAQNVVTLLNRYFTVMQNIIFRRGGSIDKCAGDNIMAHWGVVGDMEDFTASAVTASVEMQIALFRFNRDEARKAEIMLPSVPLGHGIGLNTGIVCAGNIGSDRKIEFTVIGDAVNLSARIEAMAGRFQTFIGEPTYNEIKDRLLCVRMPDCPAKNVEKPLPVYSVRGIVPPPLDIEHKGDTKHELLLSMPCTLKGDDGISVSGMVTRVTPGQGSAGSIVMQIDRHIPPGTKVTLQWNVPEKPTLSDVSGIVEKCPKDPEEKAITETVKTGSDTAKHHDHVKGMTAILGGPVAAGVLVLKTELLPPDIAAFKPGVLIPTDLKSHEDIVRA